MKKFFSAEIGNLLLLTYLAIALVTLSLGAAVFEFFYREQSRIISFGGQALLSVAVILILVFVVRRSKYAQQQRQDLITEIVNSHHTYLFNKNDEADITSAQAAVERLIDSLKQAVDFTRKVAQGESEVEWSGMNDNNRGKNQTTLAGELIRMREQMEQVRGEDQKRLWATEGLSRVAEITRQHQSDVRQLADQLLAYLVRYVKANQGMLFFWEEKKQCLTLASCHAYDKKKFIEQQIEPGEGLVGQAFLEQETTHLTEIPPSYMDITSGLGKASPSSLLLVPLKVNEQTIGILELASFGSFAEHTIKFLEEAGEIIASSVATAQLSQQTQLLLTQSQQQAEEMRAQEEEMRQNVEELQATQEEMERKAQELFRAKQEVEEKNQEAETIRDEEQKRAEEQIQARNKMLIEAKKRFDKRERDLLDQLNQLKDKN